MTATPTSRDRQREQTRSRIADTARRSFATHGYDRTTIRQIATDAGVDPALVMHYFGSKRELFKTVVRLPADPDADHPGDFDNPDEAVLAALAAKLGGMNEHTLAGLRSMLTHPDATAQARDVLEQETELLADRLDGRHADARAALLLATNLGVAVAREILELGALRDQHPDELLNLLRPAVHALSQPPAPENRDRQTRPRRRRAPRPPAR